MASEKYTEFVEDKVPEGFSNDDTTLSAVLNSAGFEDLNAERKEILENAGIKEEKVIVSPDDNVQIFDKQTIKKEPLNQEIKTENATTSNETAEDIIKSLLNVEEAKSEPTDSQSSDSTTSEPTVYNAEYVQTEVSKAVQAEREKWANIEIALKAYQDNPYEFYAKYSPHIMEKFDVEGYVNTELNKEFGEDFVINPAEIHVFNSLSNKYLRRQNEIAKEAYELQSTAKNSLGQIEQEAKNKLTEQKTNLMKKYGFQNESDFNQQVWNEVIGFSPDEVLAKLVEAKLLTAKIGSIKQNLSKPVTPPSNGLPSITESKGAGLPAQTEDIKILGQLFGEDRIRNAQNNIFH